MNNIYEKELRHRMIQTTLLKQEDYTKSVFEKMKVAREKHVINFL